jgi:hypothetical protein
MAVPRKEYPERLGKIPGSCCLLLMAAPKKGYPAK